MASEAGFGGLEQRFRRLQELGSEIQKLAYSLSDFELPERGEPPITAAMIRAILKTRRQRSQLFDGSLFSDPAWDMMLELAAARLEGCEVPVSSVCAAANVPWSTALRWMKILDHRRLVERRHDTLDGRRVLVRLTDNAFEEVLAHLRTRQSALLDL